MRSRTMVQTILALVLTFLGWAVGEHIHPRLLLSWL